MARKYRPNVWRIGRSVSVPRINRPSLQRIHPISSKEIVTRLSKYKAPLAILAMETYLMNVWRKKHRLRRGVGLSYYANSSYVDDGVSPRSFRKTLQKLMAPYMTGTNIWHKKNDRRNKRSGLSWWGEHFPPEILRKNVEKNFMPTYLSGVKKVWETDLAQIANVFETADRPAAWVSLKNGEQPFNRVTEVYDTLELAYLDFCQAFPALPEVLAYREHYTISTQSILDFIRSFGELTANKANTAIRPTSLNRQESGGLSFFNYDPNYPFVVVAIPENKTRLDVVARRRLAVGIIAPPVIVTDLIKWLENKLDQAKRATVRYHFERDGREDSVSVIIDEPQPIYPEFYPNIPNPMEVFKQFLDSSNQLMFLVGPPGTGKTSYLRAMLFEHQLRAAVAYDQKLLHRDLMFVNFLTEDEDDILIFEDAELLITSRESENNQLVTKFLNITDGIIKSNKKKLIFTTNSWKINNIDPALLRLGRCFAVMQFTSMTHEQAVIAAKVAGLKEPPAGKSEYTLADIFNQDLTVWQGRRYGF